MTDRPHSPLTLSLRSLLNRRNLITSMAAGVVTVAIAGSVAGHDDDEDHDDDRDGDDHDDDHDDDRDDRDRDDDDDIRPSGTIPPGSVEVRIDDDDADGFEPGTITIDLGQSVTWVNVDDDPHTATGASFDTGRIRPGEQATITFKQAGSVPYSCQLHPMMTGIVEVRDESGDVPSSTTASPEASPQATPASTGQRVDVSILDLAFDPADTEVTVGSTVTWINDESIPHTVTATDDSFGSDTLQQGDTFSHTFAEAGTFEYSCAIHPNMQGTVTVTPTT